MRTNPAAAGDCTQPAPVVRPRDSSEPPAQARFDPRPKCKRVGLAAQWHSPSQPLANRAAPAYRCVMPARFFEPALTTPADLRRLLHEAIVRRRGILGDPQTTACRVFHDAADGIEGLVIERLGDVLIVQRHEHRLRVDDDALRDLAEAAMIALGATACYAKRFPRDRSAGSAELDAAHRDPRPWLGAAAPEEFDILEHGLRFRVRPYDGYSTGLFLDQRANRRTLRQRAAGGRVLNAFAYTCGFSVAAAAGGASQVVSVDASKRYLEWGRRNFAANELDIEPHVFLASDALHAFKRLKRQGRRFDIVVLDPPTFGRVKGRRRAFSIARDMGPLVTAAVGLLAPGGWLLLSTNQRGLTRAHMESAVRAAAGGRAIAAVERPKLPPDFRGEPEVSRSIWVRFQAS